MARVIVRHRCLDILRRQPQTVSLTDTDAEDKDEDIKDDRIERMMSLVETLPTMQQTVLRLRHMQGMEMRDIANIIGASEVAVRQSLSRARRAIFERMKQ